MRATTAFAAPAGGGVRGLDYTFTLSRHRRDEGARRLVSTPFPPMDCVGGTWLGVTSEGFTDFDGNHPAVSAPGSPYLSPTSYLTAPPRSEVVASL